MEQIFLNPKFSYSLSIVAILILAGVLYLSMDFNDNVSALSYAEKPGKIQDSKVISNKVENNGRSNTKKTGSAEIKKDSFKKNIFLEQYIADATRSFSSFNMDSHLIKNDNNEIIFSFSGKAFNKSVEKNSLILKYSQIVKRNIQTINQ